MITPEQRLLQYLIALSITSVISYKKKGIIRGFSKSQQEQEYASCMQLLQELDEKLLELAGFSNARKILTFTQGLIKREDV